MHTQAPGIKVVIVVIAESDIERYQPLAQDVLSKDNWEELIVDNVLVFGINDSPRFQKQAVISP